MKYYVDATKSLHSMVPGGGGGPGGPRAETILNATKPMPRHGARGGWAWWPWGSTTIETLR